MLHPDARRGSGTFDRVGPRKAAGLSLDGLRKAAAKAARSAIGCTGKLGLLLPWDGLEPNSAACAVAEAVRLALYTDQRFRKEPEPRRVPEALELIGLPQLRPLPD